MIKKQRVWFFSGIQGELYYVRDGIVNDYALSFYQLVKWDVVDLYFNWQSLRQSPQEVPVCSIW